MIDQPTIAIATTPAEISFKTERKTGESKLDYANRLAESIQLLAPKHAKVLSEREYDACHHEVQRLREVLKNLSESMINANNAMSNVSLLILFRNIAAHFKRYSGLMQLMHRQLELDAQAVMKSPSMNDANFATNFMNTIQVLKADIKLGRASIEGTAWILITNI
jgi:replicative DNA helicase